MDKTFISFKSKNKKSEKIISESGLLGVEIPKDKDLLISTTYNQKLNLTHDQLATFNYNFIDESHCLTNDLSFRADTIADLVFHLIEFVVKYPKAKTKIVFMSGTPNVETLVIPKIMEEYGVEKLFQRVIVKKEYLVSPKMYLTHLDTSDKLERKNAVLKQIHNYLKNDRKVIYIFNNKDKMDSFKREINSKLGANIKVGLFYSGSEGECTENILSSKLGDFDVVLTTNYFINGININKDGITEEEFKNGKTSTQKYAVVIDLGNKYSCISAIDTIQTANRFRNRLCETTVFLPKIFKEDKSRPDRDFDFGHTSRVLYGFNRYNFHLLSNNENATPNQINEEEVVEVENVHLVDQLRKNPLSVSLNDIDAKSLQEENKNKLINIMNKESRIYQDWFYSVDGYYYLAKDAGFNVELKHVDLGEPLKEMTEDEIELENKIIKTLVNNEKDVYNMINRNSQENIRFNFIASKKITDPMSTAIGDFKITSTDDNTWTISSDFHNSYERAINKLFRCYFKLRFYYDENKAIEIMKYLIDPEVDFFSNPDKSYLNRIAAYVRSCNAVGKEKFIKALNYIKTFDYLSKNSLGVFKVDKPTWNSYTITDPNMTLLIKNMWAKQQFEMIGFKVNDLVANNDWSALNNNKKRIKKGNSRNNHFDELNGKPKKKFIFQSEVSTYLEHYANEEVIKNYDLEDLENQLKQLGVYKPLSYTKDGNLKNLETLVIPKIIGSLNLPLPLGIEDEYCEPENISKENIDIEIRSLINNISEKLEFLIPPIIRASNPYLQELYTYAIDWLQKKDMFRLLKYINDLIADPRSEYKPGLLPVAQKILKEFKKCDMIVLNSFKASEHDTYKDITIYQNSPFNKDIFFCKKDFELESLLQKPISGLGNISNNAIYNALIKNSELYKNTKSIRPRSKSGSRQTLSTTSSLTKKAHILLNEKDKLIYADFSKSKFADFVCKYAYKNEAFRLKNGLIPVKKINNGIYNPDNLRKNYLSNKAINKTIDNYKFEEYNIDVNDYVDYYKSL
tara:strand:+ start:58211 stop:61276 length:3066 start_codon:yes stop_codon:yes gene_type:complete